MLKKLLLICLKTKHFSTVFAFILLHIGQWMYTMNMPLFVTDYLKENEQHVGYLASLCAGLEVPFMIILGVSSSRLQTRTLLIYGAIFGGLFYFSIGVFKNFYMMLAAGVFSYFLAVLFRDLVLVIFKISYQISQDTPRSTLQCNGYWTVRR